MVKKSTLTERQLEILRRMKIDKEYCVYDLECNARSLDNLVRKQLLTFNDESERPFFINLHRKFKLKDKIKIVVYNPETKHMINNI